MGGRLLPEWLDVNFDGCFIVFVCLLVVGVAAFFIVRELSNARREAMQKQISDAQPTSLNAEENLHR